jgi:hypothetical protein
MPAIGDEIEQQERQGDRRPGGRRKPVQEAEARTLRPARRCEAARTTRGADEDGPQHPDRAVHAPAAVQPRVRRDTLQDGGEQHRRDERRATHRLELAVGHGV